MNFIQTRESKTPEITKSQIIWAAYRIVIRYSMQPSEILLEKYLKEKYKISLKQACLKLVLSAKVQYDSADTYIITFPTKYLKELAQVITYGTGKILGSNILKTAFKGYLI